MKKYRRSTPKKSRLHPPRERHLTRRIVILETAQKKRRKGEQKLHTLDRIVHDAVIFADRRARLTYCNRGFQRIFGYPPSEAIGRPLTFLFPGRFRKSHRQVLGQFFSGSTRTLGKIMEFVAKRKDGTEFHAELSMARWKQDRVLLHAGIIRDITRRKTAEEALKKSHDDLHRQVQARTIELRKLNKQLEKMSLTDPLTGLLNRRGLEQILLAESERTEREGHDLIAFMLDLDNFKQINETLGYAIGDVVLQGIADKILACVRAMDFVGRVGGDEFLVLLPDTRTLEALQVAERTRLAISQNPIETSLGRVTMTVSVGVTRPPRKNLSLELLLEHGNLALKHSKEAGKNRVFYKGRSRSKREQLLPISRFLEQLSRGKGFRAMTQPIYRLADESVAGYEMLCRGPAGPLEAPDDFFRICFEKNALTIADHQCAMLCLGAAQALDSRSIHINLFPTTLLEIPVAQILSLFPAGRPKSDFCVEISEQQIIGNSSHLVKPIAQMREAGLRIAIDDVGFGRSCLESLIYLEPDIIKIDRQFVNGVARDPALARSLERLLLIAKNLESQAVAEGIESREDLDLLKRMGVTHGQGFLWGKPFPVAASRPIMPA